MDLPTIETSPAAPLEIYRRARGLRRDQLGNLADVSPETVARLERQENTPHRATAKALAAALDVDVSVLWPGVDRG